LLKELVAGPEAGISGAKEVSSVSMTVSGFNGQISRRERSSRNPFVKVSAWLRIFDLLLGNCFWRN
jgi:hypothetical protein